jgi:UPF0271 protein
MLMKKFIDLNCDMGEGFDADELIMPYISSANIACGVHAGDLQTMQRTIKVAMNHHVAIGAHPSYPDREGFGRKEMNLSTDDIFNVVKAQIETINTIAEYLGGKLHHVKPHGALYNRSAKDYSAATAIAKAVFAVNPNLILYGLSNSESEKAALDSKLKFYAEVFADRTYTEDGLLTPRSEINAMIESSNDSLNQILRIINEGVVLSTSGKAIPIKADTICLHGDGEHAVEFARTINDGLKKSNIKISNGEKNS